VHTDAALCRDLFVDPSMDDADEVDRIWRGEEGDRTTGFETSDVDHSYSFSFLPSFGSEDAAGGEGQFEDWQLSLLAPP
jgi:hypothetical protein